MIRTTLNTCAFLGIFSLFCAQAPAQFTVTNATAAVVSVWVAKVHESVTHRNQIRFHWLNEDEFRGMGAVGPGESQTYQLPWVAPHGLPWQSVFFRHEAVAPLIYAVFGDPRYARQQPVGLHGDPEPERTFRRVRAVTFRMGDYTVTSQPTPWPAEHTSPVLLQHPCRLWVDPYQGFVPKAIVNHLPPATAYKRNCTD